MDNRLIIGTKNNFKNKAMETKEALEWWGSLSMNEQEKYRLDHPYFSQMGLDYFNLHKTSITQVYEHYLKTKNERKK